MKSLGLYKDLDLSFIPHPMTGDLAPKQDADAVLRSVRHLAFWNAYDLPFEPSFKSAVKKYLFEQNHRITRANLARDLKWILVTLEPRIRVRDIRVEEAQQGRAFDITITFSINSLHREETVNFIVERVR